MANENIMLSSYTTEVAEHDLYLELTSCMCYYDDENLNHVVLPYKGYEEQAEEAAKTLINMPVQAKYRKINNQDDLGSHELVFNKQTKSYEFLTDSIGVHTDAWIEEAEVTTVRGEKKKLPCLYATKRIWKRNKNVVNAIKRLFASKGGLGSSWEIATKEYIFKDGKKFLTDYMFESDCLLGSTTTPAYNGTSEVIALASMNEQELMIAEALTMDMYSSEEALSIDNQDKEDKILANKEVNVSSEEVVEGVAEVAEEVSTEETIETSGAEETPETSEEVATEETETPEVSEEQVEEPVAETAEETTVESETSEEDEDEEEEDEEEAEKKEKGCSSVAETETSAFTTGDLRRAISKACREKVNATMKEVWWCAVSFMFPEEKTVWCDYDAADKNDLDFLQFSYSVEGDVVSVGEPELVTLVASPKNINQVVAEYEKQIAEKDELIVNASSEISGLKAQVTELSEYKSRLDAIEQEKVAAELQQKKDELVASVVKSGQITAEEIASSEELSAYVDALDKKSLMAIVGERLMASMESTNTVETSSVHTEDVQYASSLNADDEVMDGSSIMRKFLGK